MPLHSKEVVTLRLILACDDGDGLDSQLAVVPDSRRSKRSAGLLDLPVEIRLQILRYLLLFERNRQCHTRRLAPGSIDHLLGLDPRHILEAPQFRHKSRLEINGVLPQYHTCSIHAAVLRVCKTVYHEARFVLYRENSFIAVQFGIPGLSGRFKNYGIPLFGRITPDRLMIAARKAPDVQRTSAATFSDSSLPTARLASFNPDLIIQGKSSTAKTPFYVCSSSDGYSLLHALWIMVKSTWVRGMRFNVLVTGDESRHRSSFADRLVKRGAIPWLHEFIDSVRVNVAEADDASQRRLSDFLSHSERLYPEMTNLNSYAVVCASLETLHSHADKMVLRSRYCTAETLYERICYEACSVVRTRTAKLVDVSTKMPDGINRICKLIAISAFRLCELRSGAIADFPQLRKTASHTPSTEAGLSRNSSVDLGISVQRQDLDLPTKTTVQESATVVEAVLASQAHELILQPAGTRTTRLEGLEAIDNAVLSGLLAFRLPCATPVSEWNIRVNEMLLTLFDRKGDHDNALFCLQRLQQTYEALLRDAKQKSNKLKIEMLEDIVRSLKGWVVRHSKRTAEERHEVHGEALAQSHEYVRKWWGERLSPKEGYTGLIWTFRWA
jgi:hypothetical protein